ncbi:MAG: chorismate-binding protein [Spirochaetota bacterium]
MSTKQAARALIRTLPGEQFTPYSLFRKLGARCLLESASFHRGKARYSIILVREAFRVVQRGDQIMIEGEGAPREEPAGGRDILEVCARLAARHRDAQDRFPVPAGGIGYLGYEYAARFDDVRLREKRRSTGIPDAAFIFGDLFLIFDHYTDTMAILGLDYGSRRSDLERDADLLEQRIHDLDFNYLTPLPSDLSCIPLIRDQDSTRFMEGVSVIRREIQKGNLLQGVLSRRLVLRTELPALEAYRRLRSLNPSPYMFFLDFGEFQLFGASPEMHVKVVGERVITRPIAGTRRRGGSREQDRALEEELLADEKERAEHLMLVDLARNDLGRVCVPGSVAVTEFMGVEHYSHVMHLVSQVEGTLAPGMKGEDAIRSTFPAGTVSGAPKIRAMEIIDGLEPEPREFYAGLVGYLEPDGSLDTCITIRSALKRDDLLVLQAGAGVVYDSVPERELDETSAKLEALISSLGIPGGNPCT